jgi:small GTP-binding protein
MSVIQKKICLLGDFAVGKTSLVRRYVEGRFEDKYLSTIGVKIARRSLPRPGGQLDLLIWDLAGSDEFNRTAPKYLRGAAGALIVCDLTRCETLDTFEYYTQLLRAEAAGVSVVFLGNKADLTGERQVSDADLQQVCAVLNGRYVLTSAKTGENVEAAFDLLAAALEGQA